MKILRIKLVNFIGIMHGMGTDEVELDFTKGKNKIIMFRGKNGSGKSTIVGSLTPFKQSTDNREQLILDGKDGRKEIDYEHNGHIYKIVHTYPAKGNAQSFISKDGIELNENGGVKTCEDIILKEFGITKDYFKIGKIGSNTKNFVDFTTADRKKYIGTFLDISDMLDKYKVVNDKLKLLKKDVISIANELKTYESKEVLETRISQLEKDIAECDKELQEKLPKQGSLEEKINHITSELKDFDINSLNTRKQEKEKDISDNSAIKEKLKDIVSTDDPEKAKEDLQNEISMLQGDIRVNTNNQASKGALYTDYNNKIAKLKFELAGLGNPEDVKKYTSLIEKGKLKKAEFETRLKQNPEFEVIKRLQNEGKDISRYLNKFNEFSSFIEKYFTDLQKKSINALSSNISVFLNEQTEESFNRQIKMSRDAISAKTDLLTSQERTRAALEAHLPQLSALEKRPSECTINSCPFISDALKWKDAKEKITECDADIAQTKKDLEILNTKADNLNDLFNLFNAFNIAYTNVNPRDNPVYAEFCKEKSLSEWIEGSFADFQNARERLIKDIKEAINDIEGYSQVLAEIAANEKSRQIYADSDDSAKERLLAEINEYTEKRDKVGDDCKKLEDEGNILAEKFKNKQDLLLKYSAYISASSKLNSATTRLSSIVANLSSANNLTNLLATYKDEYQVIKNEIYNLQMTKQKKTSEYNNALSTLTQINALNKKLQNLKDVYKPTDTITKALSPTGGIPLILIQMYLAETEKIANELLNVAYNGDFQIKFLTTDKDFKIQVITKNGEVKDDISLASQGEVALTTISISLALIEQSIGEYNILCLDEIDGPLDSTNRENFISILNSQIEKLGIEQVFVISHNNAFDAYPLDLVLLKNNDVDITNESYMENKTVIYNYADL